MKYQDPKFDAIFGNNISATLRLLEEQERNMKKFSITESAASLAIKKITEKNAGLSEVNKSIASLTSILNPVNELLAAQKSWNDKFQSIFSPAWKQMAMFSKFHEQTAHIGKILNPSISDYIQSSVRTSYAGAESISAVEATYLETFEQLDDEADLAILEEITEEIQNNPAWSEEIKTLFNAFYQEHLRDGFTDAIADFVSRRFNIKNPKIVAAFIAILIILFTIGRTLSKNKQE
jgi:hypothetical protein